MSDKACAHGGDKDECDACFLAFEVPKRTTCPHGNTPSECVACWEGRPVSKPNNVYPIRPEEE